MVVPKGPKRRLNGNGVQPTGTVLVLFSSPSQKGKRGLPISPFPSRFWVPAPFLIGEALAPPAAQNRTSQT